MSKETHINIPNSSSSEMRCGAVIAIFAALMAITDLLAGKYDADEIIGTNDKAMAYSWYQSKSIKETLVQVIWAT